MKTEKAHQIANPEILRFLKLKRNFFITTECKLVLKGILIAQEKEVEFLECLDISGDGDMGEDNSVNYDMVNDRIEALKISCEDLRKVLK